MPEASSRLQLSKLREKLEAIARELEVADKETFLSSVATEHAAELASSRLSKPSVAAKPEPADTAHKAESHGKLKPKDKKPKMKPKIDELEDAEKKPKLFEPAAGPPPKVGEEELAAEGSGQEILLQVGLVLILRPVLRTCCCCIASPTEQAGRLC